MVGVFHHAHLCVRVGLSVGEGISHSVRGEVHLAPAPTLPHLVPHIGQGYGINLRGGGIVVQMSSS